jgi:hypothetical protein
VNENIADLVIMMSLLNKKMHYPMNSRSAGIKASVIKKIQLC